MLRPPRPGAGSEQVCDFNEIVLEAGFADQLKQAGGLIARVPERVRDTARLVNVGARPRLRDLIADSHADTSLEHVRKLVLHRVGVRRYKAPGFDRVLDDCEAATCLVTPDLEVHAQPLAELD